MPWLTEERTTSLFEPKSTQQFQHILLKLLLHLIGVAGASSDRGSGEEEDGHAVAAAQAVAQGQKDKTFPPFIGIRLKPFNEELKRRSIRTLDLFVTALHEATGGNIPQPFYITLPKITVPEQAEARPT